MRKIIYIAILLITVWSCRQDDSNFDYLGLELSFEEMVDKAEGFQGSDILIEGVFETNIPEANLTYLWWRNAEIGNLGQVRRDTLSQARNFDQPLNLPPGSGVELNYWVTDTESGAVYEHTVFVEVVNAFGLGWGILKERNGAIEYDFMSDISGDLAENLFEATQEPENRPTGTLVTFDYVYNRNQRDIANMVVLTSENGFQYDANTLDYRFKYLDRFTRTPELTLPITGGQIDWFAYDNGAGGPYIIDSDGNLYNAFIPFGVPFDPTFNQVPLQDIKVANNNIHGSQGGVPVFDETTKSFKELAERFNFSDEPKELVYDAMTDAFDPNNMNRDCIFLEKINGRRLSFRPSLESENIAVMKDNLGTYYYIQYVADRGTNQDFIGVADIALPIGAVTENSSFAINRDLREFYIATGGAIHRVSAQTQAVQENFISDYASENITDIAVSNDGLFIALALDNGANSSVVVYDLLNRVEVKSQDIDGKIFELKHRSDPEDVLS
ncbi:MAG: hypothetical protein GDA42_05375 [Ekhidna sp.]|nr:hypothetical protein [Ekhidna sp.]MBC6409876.1 hypothetical protein [Ekhidna sp.]